MKSLICATTGQPIHLINQISVSGEGEIWETDTPSQLAKIYTSPQSDRIRKLQTMVAYPPKDPNRMLDHVSLAWPTSLLRETYGVDVGFLMPRIMNGLELINVYNPKRRKHILPGFNWYYLHTTALNLASLIGQLHTMGFVVGDIKPQNILVNSHALPSIIDTDSFQIRHPQTGEVFLCPVGSEGFTPRELLGKDLSTIYQSDVHDRFRLGIIIHLLLFGEHPFKGQWVGPGDSPEPNELIEKGYWPFSDKTLVQSGPSTFSLNVVHPKLKANFIRCFNEGHENPNRRPSAQEWVNALNTAIDDLKRCWVDHRHYYSATYGRCIWCERRRKLGVDVFNPNDAVVPSPTKTHALNKGSTKGLHRPHPRTMPLPQNSNQRGNLKRSPNFQTASSYQKPLAQGMQPSESQAVPNGKKVIAGMGLFLGLFSLLIGGSSFEMTSDEIGLSFAGAIACLLLFLIGLFWIKLLKRLENLS